MKISKTAGFNGNFVPNSRTDDDFENCIIQKTCTIQFMLIELLGWDSFQI